MSQSGKKPKGKKKNSGQTPFAGRIIQTWRRMEELDQRSAKMEEAVGADAPEVHKIQAQWSDEAGRFERLLAQTYEDRTFGRTLASVERQMLSGPQASVEDFARLLEDMAKFHKNPEYTLLTPRDGETTVRVAIYGVPAAGNQDHLKEVAADPKFTALQRATGFIPSQSNVISMGVMEAGDALMLAHEPLKVWNLARHTLSGEARIPVGPHQLEGLMQKSQDGEYLTLKDKVNVGGHVILMAVFALGEDPIEAVDTPEESTVEAWLKAKKDYEDEHPDLVVYMDMPCELADAARMAISLQIMQTLQMTHAMDHPHAEASKPRDAAFIYSDRETSLDLVGRFEDGSHVRISEILPVEALPSLADIAEGMGFPTTLTTDADLSQWHALLDGADNEESLESQSAPAIRPARPRMH